MDKKTLKSLTKNPIAVVIIVQVIFSLLLLDYSLILSLLLFLSTLSLAFLNWRAQSKRMKNIGEYIENLSFDLSAAANGMILNAPVPMLIMEDNGDIIWYNESVTPVFDGEELFDENILNKIHGLSADKLAENQAFEQRIGDKFYQIMPFAFEAEDGRDLRSFFFQDISDYKRLQVSQQEKQTIMALLAVDNYEDVINECKEDKRPFVTAEIDKKINVWASRMNAVLKKIEKDRYIVIFEHKYLYILESKRFTLLDEMREIDLGNRIAPTLSIGVAATGDNLSQLEENAFAALELALGRGGDQAVVKKLGDYEFYGGKSKAAEKRNKVKARIIAHALRPIIDQSDNIFVMGHKFPDMDSYGAAIGICQAAINRGKEAYIVLEEVNETIRFIHDMFKDDSVFKFIRPKEALESFTDADLLVVVDTNKPSLTESPELEERAVRKVLFDHHRRGTEFIENTLLTYLEPYASSACELVTEVLQYMERKVVIDQKVAEALLAGIAVDTKNFSVKTGVRTFESAAILRRFNADTTHVRNLFKDDLSTFVARSNIVSNAEALRPEIAVSTTDAIIENARLVAAQGADSLLSIRGVKGAFVIVKQDEEIFLSGRSMGEINVQIICEKLGGGGHLTGAGAQFKDCTIDDVKELLTQAVDEYYQEEA